MHELKQFYIDTSGKIGRRCTMHNYTRKAYLNVKRFIFDVMVVTVTYPVAIWVTRMIHPSLDWMELLWLPLLYLIIFIFSMNWHGLYEATTFTYQDRTLRGVTSSCMIASILCLVFVVLVPQTTGNTDFLAFYSLISVLFLGLRYILALSIGNSRGSFSASQLLLMGTPEQIIEYLFYLKKTGFNVRPIGFLSDDSKDTIPELPRLGHLKDLSAILQEKVVDEVVLAFPKEDLPFISPILQECSDFNVITKVSINAWNAGTARCYVHSVGPLPVLIYHRTNLSSFQKYFKRSVDVIGAVIGLIIAVLFSLIIVPSIALSDKGPILVKIPRNGLNGRAFKQFLFRVTKTGKGIRSRDPNDMTGIGRILVRTRLQHLPSLMNVLIGDMSIVGTRVLLQSENGTEKIHRVSQKPGLTGVWNIKDFDRSMNDEDLGIMDREYSESWNMIVDIKILLLTPIIWFIHRIIGHATNGEEQQ